MYSYRVYIIFCVMTYFFIIFYIIFVSYNHIIFNKYVVLIIFYYQNKYNNYNGRDSSMFFLVHKNKVTLNCIILRDKN